MIALYNLSMLCILKSRCYNPLDLISQLRTESVFFDHSNPTNDNNNRYNEEH